TELAGQAAEPGRVRTHEPGVDDAVAVDEPDRGHVLRLRFAGDGLTEFVDRLDVCPVDRRVGRRQRPLSHLKVTDFAVELERRRILGQMADAFPAAAQINGIRHQSSRSNRPPGTVYRPEPGGSSTSVLTSGGSSPERCVANRWL